MAGVRPWKEWGGKVLVGKLLYLHCSHAHCKIDFLWLVRVLSVLSIPSLFLEGEDLHTTLCGTVFLLRSPWCTQTTVPSCCIPHRDLK